MNTYDRAAMTRNFRVKHAAKDVDKKHEASKSSESSFRAQFYLKHASVIKSASLPLPKNVPLGKCKRFQLEKEGTAAGARRKMIKISEYFPCDEFLLQQFFNLRGDVGEHADDKSH